MLTEANRDFDGGAFRESRRVGRRIVAIRSGRRKRRGCNGGRHLEGRDDLDLVTDRQEVVQAGVCDEYGDRGTAL